MRNDWAGDHREDMPLPPLPTKRTSRLSAWAALGIPQCSVNGARDRVRISRLKRSKREPTATLSVNAPAALIKQIDALADHYDVSRAQAVRRLIEDGLKRPRAV